MACVEGGRELGFGRSLEAGIWMRRVAAALKSNRASTRPNEQESITENGFCELVAWVVRVGALKVGRSYSAVHDR